MGKIERSMLKSINKKAVVKWPLLHITAEAQCTVSTSTSTLGRPILSGVGIIMQILVLNLFFS